MANRTGIVKSTLLPKQTITHKELVLRAARWLRNTRGCSVVLTELVTAAGETPDAIGWQGSTSISIECKTSRADFLRDRQKTSHRANTCVGYVHYYLVPPGLVKADEVPPYWGLLECHDRQIKVVKKSVPIPIKNGTENDFWASIRRTNKEVQMLLSAIRRQDEIIRLHKLKSKIKDNGG